MAKKPSVTTITSGYASNTQLNANFTALRNAFDNTLSLDGSTPNAMLADLDLNNNDLLNVNAIEVVSIRSGGEDIDLSGISTLAPIASEIVTLAQLQDGTVLLYGLSELHAVKDDIAALGPVASSIPVVASIDTEVVAVNGLSSEITTVAGISSDVTTVSGLSADIATVVSIESDITTVAGISADVTTVAGISTDVTTVSTYSTEVNVVADDLTAGSFVAGSEYDFGSIADPTSGTSGSPDGFIVTVFNNLADITTVANIDGNVTTVAGIAADVTTVAGITGNITSVLAISSDITTVAGIDNDVTAVAAIDSDVTTVAGISADVSIVAANVVDVTNFSDVYYGPSATAPTTRKDSSALQVGDLYFDTVSDIIKVWDGAAWIATVATLSGALVAANNLSDLTDTSAARTNLGLGSAATSSTTDFAAASHTHTLSDVTDAGTMAAQDSDDVNITGGVIDGGSIV